MQCNKKTRGSHLLFIIATFLIPTSKTVAASAATQHRKPVATGLTEQMQLGNMRVLHQKVAQEKLLHCRWTENATENTLLSDPRKSFCRHVSKNGRGKFWLEFLTKIPSRF
ncbi:hypothetical protein ACO0LB_03195 [Undibacterium sp. SXout7W]|uniref:hypothetical protein n=1 Tax=Undibacterium sp. SXout7W TaxID=3413049 RepID=UPI003BF37C81